LAIIKQRFFTIATVLWVGGLLLATFLPGQDLPEVSIKLNDKLVHVVMYFILTALLLGAIWREKFLGLDRKQTLPFTLSIIGLMAIGTEFLQSFVPGRLMSIYDIIANLLGMLLGLIGFFLIRKKGWM